MKKVTKQKLEVVDEVTNSEKLDALFERNQDPALEGFLPPRTRFDDMQLVFRRCNFLHRPPGKENFQKWEPRLNNQGKSQPYDRKTDGIRASVWVFEPVTQNSFQAKKSQKTHDHKKQRTVDGKAPTVTWAQADYQVTIWEQGSWGKRFEKYNLTQNDRVLMSGRLKAIRPEKNGYPCQRQFDSASVALQVQEEQVLSGNITNEQLAAYMSAIA